MIHMDWILQQSGIGWNFYIRINKENFSKYFILKTETTKVPQCLAEEYVVKILKVFLNKIYST